MFESKASLLFHFTGFEDLLWFSLTVEHNNLDSKLIAMNQKIAIYHISIVSYILQHCCDINMAEWRLLFLWHARTTLFPIPFCLLNDAGDNIDTGLEGDLESLDYGSLHMWIACIIV